MKELAALLRQFADRVESGLQLKDAQQCAIVLATEAGVAQATDIGRGVPRENAGILLLTQGIQLWNNDMAAERTSGIGGFASTAREHALMPSELKVALVGSAPSSCRLAPYQDTDWQIWGCSPGLYGVAPRVTEWYELHLWEPGQTWFSPEYCQWLKALPSRGVTLWTGADVPELPGSKVFDFDAVQNEFDPHDWFCSSTLYWMMARAMQLGATKIGLWGVDMAAGEEYEMQRAGLHFLSYMARARGIEVGVPMESDLFTPRFRYGQHEWSHGFRKWRARKAELEFRKREADTAARAKADEAYFLGGAIDDLNYMHSTWMDRAPRTGPDKVPVAFVMRPPPAPAAAVPVAAEPTK